MLSCENRIDQGRKPDSKMSLKVLLLKENASHGATLAMVVTAMGHQVNVVATRPEALAELATSKYDVVVSSLHFEKASALDFLRMVKAADGLPDKPFVFCCIRPGSIIKGMTRILGQDSLLLVVDQYDDPRLETALADIDRRLLTKGKRSQNQFAID